MNTRSIHCFAAVIGLTGLASAQLLAQNNWTRKAVLPTARMGLSISVVNAKPERFS